MKIKDALLLKKEIRCESLNMYKQDPNSLIHWLLIDKYTTIKQKKELLVKILKAKDWETYDSGWERR